MKRLAVGTIGVLSLLGALTLAEAIFVCVRGQQKDRLTALAEATNVIPFPKRCYR